MLAVLRRAAYGGGEVGDGDVSAAILMLILYIPALLFADRAMLSRRQPLYRHIYLKSIEVLFLILSVLYAHVQVPRLQILPLKGVRGHCS